MRISNIMAAITAALLAIALANPAEARKRHKQPRTTSQAVSQCVYNDTGRIVCPGPVNSMSARPRAGNVAASGGFSSSSLVNEARKYIGTNPTGRASLWCGAFMDLVLRRTGHQGGGNLASAYARYGTRVSGPQIGAIAVMGRKGGGHVGVVSGIDANGNPVIISGNHNRTTAESVYPRSRIYAYVIPR